MLFRLGFDFIVAVNTCCCAVCTCQAVSMQVATEHVARVASDGFATLSSYYGGALLRTIHAHTCGMGAFGSLTELGGLCQRGPSGRVSDGDGTYPGWLNADRFCCGPGSGCCDRRMSLVQEPRNLH